MDTEEKDEKWTTGGKLGSRGAILLFRCSALSTPPVTPPAEKFHMVYKTHQAETKLLAALLSAHGFAEELGLISSSKAESDSADS